MNKKRKTIYEKYIKRMLDITCSGGALIVLAVPMGVVSLLIYYTIGKPVIFRQERIGMNEEPFTLYKFRSMKEVKDADGISLPDSERLTKFGDLIRKTSIDELPSLINIVRGDMSIVGPRPLPTNYLPWFTEQERKRHLVRGGLTGLAQINGRNTVGWEERFQYDLEYVDNISFRTDFQIILQTAMQVIRRKDIGARGFDAPQDFHVYRSGMSEKELKLKDLL